MDTICPRSVCSKMLEDEVVTLSEDSENENAVSSDSNARQNVTLVQQKLDEQEHEMQKLRDRVEELEIEKVQSEIDIMELEQQVTSLQSLSSNKCDCSSQVMLAARCNSACCVEGYRTH